MNKQDEFLERLERLMEKHCRCREEPAGMHRQVWCDPCPPLAPVRQQYEQSLARYNDQVAANAAQMQAAQTQLYQTWGAHMMRLQADITSGN